MPVMSSPVSSLSSRRAASSGVSPGSMSPAGRPNISLPSSRRNSRMSSICSPGSSVMIIMTASTRGCSSFSGESMPGSRENIS